MKKLFSFIITAALSFSVYALEPPIVNVAQAVEIGMGLEAGASTDVEYEVTGYVIDAGSFSLMYMNQCWYMADDATATTSDFQAYN